MSYPSADNLLLGAGAIYLDKSASNLAASAGYRHLGNCPSFKLASTAVRVDVPRNAASKLTDLASSRIVGFKVTGSFTLNEFAPENIALLMNGMVDTSLYQAAATVTGQEYEDIRKGKVIRLQYGRYRIAVDVSAVYVDGILKAPEIDYVVNKRAGLLIIPYTSTIPDGATITVDWSFADKQITQMSIANEAIDYGKLMYVGDPTTGPAHMIVLPKVQFDVPNPLDLIGEDFAAVEVNFTVIEHAAGLIDSAGNFNNIVEI